MTIKYLSLFSGIGGFEYGLEKSRHDFECVGFSEIDKYAKSIYKRHFPNHFDWGDVTKINTSDLPEFEFLVGGFPCQAFSIAGKRRGFDDTRGTLFFEIARILKDKRPRYFLLENVKGLLSHEKGKTFQRILEVLSDLGYDVEWEVLNSKNFGVPQNRERIFIKGYSRNGEGREILCQRRINKENTSKLNTYRDKNRTYSLYPNIDTITRTLTGEGQNSGNRMLFNFNNRFARLTPRECERLQGFPDDWTRYGVDDEPISDSQRYKCCGNAVTTNVITFIANNWIFNYDKE